MAFDEALLKPIEEANPGGSLLRYSPLYDQIQEARREDDDLPRGPWEKPRKTADLDQVIRITADALAHQSKDLQLAAWWTEAMVRRVGMSGLTDGLTLMAGLIERFWDVLYPEEPELRAAPLDWMDMKLAERVRQVPLTRDRYNWYDYRESRSRSAADVSVVRAHGRAHGPIDPDTFDSSARATSDGSYELLVAEIATAREALTRLIGICDQKYFDGPSPAFHDLGTALESVDEAIRTILRVRGNDATAAAADTDARSPASGNAAVLAHAASLRAADPTDPLPYLLLRAVQWGTLSATAVAEGSLAAPSSEARAQVALAHAEKRWRELLDICEGQLECPWGRGWLDLQRYAWAACDALGPRFTPVGDAILAETGAVLSRFPSLETARLADGTPAGDSATVEWLGRLRGGLARTVGSGPETSARSRFLTRLQLARECVANGQPRVGCAVAEELIEEADRRQLDQWESPDLLLEPLLILFESTGDIERKRMLFNRICRLNPRVAIARRLDPDG